MLNAEELHSNHLKILKFLYPGEPIKSWVIDDEKENGHYHKEYDWVFKLVEKIESLSTRVIPIEFKIRNSIVEICVYESMRYPITFYFYHKSNYTDDKVMAIYECAIAFIDWYEKIPEDHVLHVNPASFTAPEQVLVTGKVTEYKRIFLDLGAIEDLKSTICRVFGINMKQFESKSRRTDIVKARQLAMTILVVDGYTTTAVGRILDKDHSTVVYAKRAIINLIDSKDKLFYNSIMEVLTVFDMVEIFKRIHV